MFKRHLWKLTFSLLIAVWAIAELHPIQDRDLTVYLQSEAGGAKRAEFDALLKEANQRVAAKQAQSTYVALKQIGRERKLDLTQFFPSVAIESTLTNVEKRNNLLLDHLLKQSKSKFQLGLDLRGGVAFTLEVDPKALANSTADANKEKIQKAIEIIEARINGLGVAEPVIRPVGENRIEVQLAGISTKDNPDIVENLKKPARLEFRTVHPFLTPTGSPADSAPAGYVALPLEDDNRGQSFGSELYVKVLPEATGEIISTSFPTMDDFGKYRIILRFTEEGRKRFAEVTRTIVQESAATQRVGRLAIVLDGKLYSAPSVQKEIDGESAEISGSFTQREAVELANVLNNPLDLPMSVKEQYEVGPSLAQDAVDSGVRASLIGTAAVAGFMIVFYTAGGIVSVITLAINLLIIFGFMASIGATLTLPGLAGIVLTIGMAVDANILIYERMREELAAGKSLLTANQSGYLKALWTILDAHIVQLIICAIMIGFGTGPIKGFGVTLAIGVLATLFSVLVTGHMLMEWLVESETLKKFSMRHLLKHINVDFVKFGKPAFIGSWLVVLLGVGVVAYKGSSIYGIDFAGGDVVSIQFKEKIDTAKIRQVAQAAGIGEIIPTYTQALGGGTEVLKIETAFGKSDAVLAALQKAHPNAGLVSVGTAQIGATIGAEIQRNAFLAVGISMLAILVYIAFRFEFGFGVGAMFSTFHDIVMTIGIFVLFGHQFSAPMVAAILAIAGYSINETVVVFDRIREELKENPTGTLREVVNSAINKVFARTIMTASTTFLAALSLFLFGGGVLKDIAFTFLVGIVTSTFSAIFIAAQVFYWWHKGDRKHVEAHQDVKPTYEWSGSSNASK